jgi:N-acetylmuramoyl-L-alanine amidase
MKLRSIKTILLTTCLTVALSFSYTVNAYGATYTVVKGDTLYKLSKTFNTTVENLMKDNNLKNSMILIGQTLNISDKTTYNTDFKALMNEAVAKGDYALAAYYEQQRNEKIAALNLAYEQTYFYQNYSVAETKSVSYSAEELDLLSRLIMAETESQPYEAKIAVGAVVINRIQSGKFPTTISGVINQTINGYYQFSPVENGWINRPANEDCINAAKAALSGQDPSKGALFYYDTSTKNSWILSKPVSVKIGKMVYAY